MVLKFEEGYSEWLDHATCDRCGRLCWGYEFESKTSMFEDVSIQLCGACLREMGNELLAKGYG
jgi:hypothetical protein